MALEAVDTDTGGEMATGAKVLTAVDSCDFTIGIGCYVTVYAFGQAGVPTAYSFAHGLVAFMHQHAHMRTAHFIKRSDTLIAFGSWHNITFVITTRTEIFTRDRLA